jgi:hypothetical protein
MRSIQLSSQTPNVLADERQNRAFCGFCPLDRLCCASLLSNLRQVESEVNEVSDASYSQKFY